MERDTSLERIHELLLLATSALDSAASHVRDAPLEPVKDNVRRIGTILTEIFDLQERVFEIRPELKPAILGQSPEFPSDGQAYGKLLLQVRALCDAGETSQARDAVRAFLATKPPPLLRDMADKIAAALEADC